MSLVAYGASDDSSESDEDTPLTSPQVNSSISTPAVYNAPGNNNNSHVKIEEQSKLKTDVFKPVEESISDEDEPSHFLKDLPAPKQPVNGRVDIAEDDVLEDLVKAKPSQISQISRPAKTRNKGRQSVKITVPALVCDLDEDEPERKKIKRAVKGSGLFSLLPAPRNVSLKEINRTLIPHTLKKPGKDVKSKEKVSSVKSGYVPFQPLVSMETGSDSDEESVSFFSLTQNNPAPSSVSFYQASSSLATLPNAKASTVKDSSVDNSLKDSYVPQESTQDNSSQNSRTLDISGSSQDLPLSFKSNSEYPSLPSLRETQTSYSVHQQYHHGYPTTEQYLAEQETGEVEVEQLLQDEEFLKLQGKAGRGREEVKFIDVDTNQFTGTQDLMKTLTVEKEHTAHRKKDNQPSGRQRSKHQITYLAFQAKERELTLKNQWSQNRQTKRQTQSKYGF